MKRKDIDMLLERAVQEKRLVDIYRSKIDPSYIRGFILGVSPKLILIQWEDNFRLDGYGILQRKDIDAVQIADANEYTQTIYRGEGVYDAAMQPDTLENIMDWQQAFSAAQAGNEWVSIECETLDGGLYFLGKVLDTKKTMVQIAPLNDQGEMGIPRKLYYKDITCLRFSSHYIRVHAKYIAHSA